MLTVSTLFAKKCGVWFVDFNDFFPSCCAGWQQLQRPWAPESGFFLLLIRFGLIFARRLFSFLRSFFTLSSSSSKDAILLFNSCPGVLKATGGLGA